MLVRPVKPVVGPQEVLDPIETDEAALLPELWLLTAAPTLLLVLLLVLLLALLLALLLVLVLVLVLLLLLLLVMMTKTRSMTMVEIPLLVLPVSLLALRIVACVRRHRNGE